MKKKTIIRIISIALMVAMIAMCIHNVAFAMDWTPDPNQGEDGGAGDSIKNIINAILRIAQIVGIGVAVIMLVVLVIKYIGRVFYGVIMK